MGDYTPQLGHKTQRNQAGTGLQVSPLLSSPYNARSAVQAVGKEQSPMNLFNCESYVQ